MKIRVYRTQAKLIETMELEEYLRGVVPAEIGTLAADEALKAQAVASRTFALRHIIADRKKSYDVTDTTADQVYNRLKINPRADAAIKATEGLVMLYDYEPIGAWFSSSNGGRIKSSKEKWGGKELPYSVSKDDPFDVHGGGGHGVGMSQYGAMEMASQGYSYIDILEYYYNNEFMLRPVSQAFTGNLKRGMKGEVVQNLQRFLLAAGELLPRYGADSDFGGETLVAVKNFQKYHKDQNGKKLTVDGVIGKKTWISLMESQLNFADKEPEVADTETETIPEPNTKLPANIGATAAAAILSDLEKVSDARKEIVTHALMFAYDPEVPVDYPYSLYIWGGNLYNDKDRLNFIDDDYLAKEFVQDSSRYEAASRAMMRAAVINNPNITGADCSGGIIGLLRHFGYVKPNEDATADGLCGSSRSVAIKKAELLPGDWVGRTGHIGMYVGGGYVVEWYGQAKGCQLTKLGTRRKAWDFVDREFTTLNEWTKYRRPKDYGGMHYDLARIHSCHHAEHFCRHRDGNL